MQRCAATLLQRRANIPPLLAASERQQEVGWWGVLHASPVGDYHFRITQLDTVSAFLLNTCVTPDCWKCFTACL